MSAADDSRDSWVKPWDARLGYIGSTLVNTVWDDELVKFNVDILFRNIQLHELLFLYTTTL